MKKKLKLGFEQLGKEMLVLPPNALSYYFGGTPGPRFDCVPVAIDNYLATFGTGGWISGDEVINTYDAVYYTNNSSASGGVNPEDLNDIMDLVGYVNGFTVTSHTATDIANSFENANFSIADYAGIGYYNKPGGGSHAVNVTRFEKINGEWEVFYYDYQNDEPGNKKASEMVGMHVFHEIPEGSGS